MSNVTNIKPTMVDKILELLDEAEDIVVLGAGNGDLKVVSSATGGNLLLMLEAAKAEVVASYIDEL